MASGRKLAGALINFGVALLLVLLAVSRVYLGYLPASRRGHAAITLADNPAAFLITIALMLFGSFIFGIFGVLSIVSAFRKR